MCNICWYIDIFSLSIVSDWFDQEDPMSTSSRTSLLAHGTDTILRELSPGYSQAENPNSGTYYSNCLILAFSQ